MSCINKYSTPWVNTLWKRLWQRLQLRVFLGISVSALYIWIWGFSSILPCRFAQALSRWMGSNRWTAIFKSFHGFSMGLKSGLWLGHSRIFTFLFWSRSSVALAVCLGSLSCWNVNLRHSLRAFAFWIRFSSRICLYLTPFIVPSIFTSPALPATEKNHASW